MAKAATRAKGKEVKKARRIADTGKRSKRTDAAPGLGKEEKNSNGGSAADAIVGLLESPIVADILAAGAAAALASITHHRLTRRRESSSRQALKEAVKSAAAAMGARLSEEFEEILDSARKAKAEAK